MNSKLVYMFILFLLGTNEAISCQPAPSYLYPDSFSDSGQERGNPRANLYNHFHPDIFYARILILFPILSLLSYGLIVLYRIVQHRILSKNKLASLKQYLAITAIQVFDLALISLGLCTASSFYIWFFVTPTIVGFAFAYFALVLFRCSLCKTHPFLSFTSQ